MIKRLLGKFVRMRKNEDGATAIEFAMLAAPFLVLLIGVFESATMLLVNYEMDDAVADVARQIRTGQAQAAGMSAGAFKKAVCKRIVLMSNCESQLLVDVKTFPDFSSLSFPPALVKKTQADGTTYYVLNSSVGSSFDIGGAKTVVGVRVYYPYHFITKLIAEKSGMTDYGDVKLLSTAAAFQNEPFK